MYNDFLGFWVYMNENKICPVYFIRYEDVLANPYKELKSMFEFIFDIEDAEGTFLGAKLKDAVERGQEAS